jgi:hypothetical protein
MGVYSDGRIKPASTRATGPSLAYLCSQTRISDKSWATSTGLVM